MHPPITLHSASHEAGYACNGRFPQFRPPVARFVKSGIPPAPTNHDAHSASHEAGYTCNGRFPQFRPPVARFVKSGIPPAPTRRSRRIPLLTKRATTMYYNHLTQLVQPVTAVVLIELQAALAQELRQIFASLFP
jgi:hypothetical protein